MRDCYKTLGVERSASPKEIKAAFRKLAKELHPDTKTTLEEKASYEEEFKVVNKCYEILSKTKSRREYDKQPQPEISVAQIDFGCLHQGEAAIAAFKVENLGSPAHEINFNLSENNSWFWITELVYFSNAETFPCEVIVEVETANLRPKQSYKGWVEVDLDGIIAKVDLFLLVEYPYFVFRSGEKAYKPEELVSLCDLYWEEATVYLQDNRAFKDWFIKLGRQDVVTLLEQSQKEKNKNIALERFLQSLDPSLASPKVEINVTGNKFGDHHPHSWIPSAKVQIKNIGRGCCYGTLDSGKTAWIRIAKPDFVVLSGQDHAIEIAVNSGQLKWESTYEGQITIKNNSFSISSVKIGFSISTPRHPERIRIETMLSEGKWQTAKESLSSYRREGDWAKQLEQRANSIKTTYLISIIGGTSVIYLILGFAAIDLFEYAPLAAIAGPIGAILYTNDRGGRNGYAADFALGSLTGLGILLVIVAAVYLIIFILIIIALGAFLGGG